MPIRDPYVHLSMISNMIDGQLYRMVMEYMYTNGFYYMQPVQMHPKGYFIDHTLDGVTIIPYERAEDMLKVRFIPNRKIYVDIMWTVCYALQRNMIPFWDRHTIYPQFKSENQMLDFGFMANQTHVFKNQIPSDVRRALRKVYGNLRE